MASGPDAGSPQPASHTVTARTNIPERKYCAIRRSAHPRIRWPLNTPQYDLISCHNNIEGAKPPTCVAPAPHLCAPYRGFRAQIANYHNPKTADTGLCGGCAACREVLHGIRSGSVAKPVGWSSHANPASLSPAPLVAAANCDWLVGPHHCRAWTAGFTVRERAYSVGQRCSGRNGKLRQFA